MRICATILLLPDITVEGTRSLVEIGRLGQETNAAKNLDVMWHNAANAARERMAAILNPARHPGPINRRRHRVSKHEAKALARAQAADEATSKLRVVKYRDIYGFQGAAGLLTVVPPGVAVSAEQNRQHEAYKTSLAPHGGMPVDVRLEMRVTGHSRKP